MWKRLFRYTGGFANKLNRARGRAVTVDVLLLAAFVLTSSWLLRG